MKTWEQQQKMVQQKRAKNRFNLQIGQCANPAFGGTSYANVPMRETIINYPGLQIGFFYRSEMALLTKNKTVIVIAGPTAVGKTAVAIEVAKHFKTEIISADSRQCFKEMNIGVARPSEEELQQVKHHFIASHSIHEKVTAVTFEQYALKKARELFQQHDTIVMTGGTGLYIKAFCEGLDDIPEVPMPVRRYDHHTI